MAAVSATNRDKAQPLKHPLALKKIVKYPDRVGDKISTQVRVRHDHKKVPLFASEFLHV